LAHFLKDFVPPDISADFLSTTARALVSTIAIASAAMIIAVPFSFILGIGACSKLWREHNILSDTKTFCSIRPLAVGSWSIAALLNIFRAIPDLIWALLFVAAIGLGSLAGVLALAISYVGILGKMYADIFDEVDMGPLEALYSSGASRIQLILLGIVPQAFPNLLSYTLYSLECCIRSASILGFVGAGGIGYEISLSVRLFKYGQVCTLMLAMIGALLSIDLASRYIRKALCGLAPSPRHGKSLATKGSHQIVTFVAIIVFVALPCFEFLSAPATWASFSSSSFIHGLQFLSCFFPPNLSIDFLFKIVHFGLETIAISLLGTAIGVVGGAGVALILIDRSRIYLEMPSSPLILRTLRYGTTWLVRCLTLVGRAIPELIWALLCVVTVGFGALAGLLALGIHTIGILGRLFAETIEETDHKAAQALHACGSSWIQVLLWALWPRARPVLVKYVILRWEANVRAATILGLVGAGGIGEAIYNNVQLGFYPKVATLVLAVTIMTFVGDRASLKAQSSGLLR
jgi:phosphonate transport system permease protein